MPSESMSFWAAVSALVGVGGFGMALIIHIVNFAYKHGKSEQRMETLEGSLSKVAGKTEALETAHNGLAVKTESLNSKIDTLTRDTGEIKAMVASLSSDFEQMIRSLLSGEFRAPRRRAAKAAAE